MEKQNASEADAARRSRLVEINASPHSRDELEQAFGEVWNTEELARDFVVVGFLAPLVVARRRRDGALGSLEFQHAPRYYFSFTVDQR